MTVNDPKDFYDWYLEAHDPDDGGGPPFGQDDMQEAFEAGYKLAASRYVSDEDDYPSNSYAKDRGWDRPFALGPGQTGP